MILRFLIPLYKQNHLGAIQLRKKLHVLKFIVEINLMASSSSAEKLLELVQRGDDIHT